MAAPEQIAAYYQGYPDPKDSRTWGVSPTGVRNRSFAAAQATWEATHGSAPQPSPVPGPPSPGAGMAAARLGDTTAHGGTIGPVTTGVAARVFIGNKPAACLGDPHVCPMFSGPKAHGGGTITKGSATVLIGSKPAARIADLTVCTAEPGQVALGEMTVLIGDLAGAGAAEGSGGASDAGSATAGAQTTEGSPPNESAPDDAASGPPVKRQAGQPVQSVGDGQHWISIELVNEAEQPMIGEAYRITLPNGTEVRGALDGNGQARLNGLKDPGVCQIAFPRLDAAAWHRWSGSRGTAAAPNDAALAAALTGRDAPVPGGSASRLGTWRRTADGDCVSSFAADAGHFWQTIWDHASNAELKRSRVNPNVLRDGDAVFVPALRPKTDTGATDQHHRYVRRGEPAQLRLRVLDEDEPVAESPWVLEVDGRKFEGLTDADGNLMIPILGNAHRAVLRVGPPGDEVEYELDLGTVDPIHTESGVRTRLANLGFLRDGSSRSREAVADAIRSFQSRRNLATTGTMDDPTRAKLLEEHGS